MTLRNRLKEPSVLIRAGLLFLILASFSRWYFHPSVNFSAGFIDGANGFLYGVSIGCLLLGIWRKGHPRSKMEAGPPAS